MTNSENTNSLQVRFGSFVLQQNPECLKQGSDLIKLRPKTLKVLRYLVERPGQLVNQEELLRRLWEGRAVSDSGLRLCVREIRAALGDNASSPQFLETVRGGGYRFLQSRNGRAIIQNVKGPIVGRAVELTLLEDHYRSATEGNTKLSIVSGEPGIGKTTLVNQFLNCIIQQTNPKIIHAHCVAHFGKEEAYGPLLQAFLKQCQQSGTGKGTIDILRRYAPSWLLQLPGLISPAEIERLQQQVESASPERMMREMLQTLEQLANQNPLVLVVEDLHWADPSTIDLLGLIAQTCKASVFVLATYRPADAVLYARYLRELIAELGSHDLCTELALELLSTDEVSLYLRGRLNGPVSDELIVALFQRSNGNPLFLINIVEDLIQKQLIAQEQGTWIVKSDTGKFNFNIPQSLRSLISRRVNALPDSQNLILETASVIGFDFSVAAISGALNQPAAEIERECEVMAESGLFIEARSAEKLPDGTITGTYQFQHPLYTEVVYDQIGDARKALLSRTIAEHLEKLYGDKADQVAPALANYYERGLDTDRALHFRILSAKQAMQRHAYPETITQLSRALELLRRTPESPERDQQELDILVMLGPTQVASLGYASPDVAETYDYALQLLEDKAHDSHHIPVLWNLAAYYMVRAELPRSNSLISQVVELTESEQNIGLKLMARDAQAQQLFFEGDFKGAQTNIDVVLDSYDLAQHRGLAREYGQEDPGIACYTFDAIIQFLTKSTSRALDRIEAAKSLAAQLDNPHSHSFYLLFTSFVSQFRGQATEVQKNSEAVLDLANEYSINWTPFALVQLAWAKGTLLRDRECLKQIDYSLEQWDSTGAAILTPYFLYLRADLALTLGEFVLAQESLEEAISKVAHTHECWLEADLHRLLGVSLLKQDRIEDAVERFYRALHISRVRKMRFFELRAALDLARLMLQQGQQQNARELLEPIVKSHASHKDLEGLDQATELLQSIS